VLDSEMRWMWRTRHSGHCTQPLPRLVLSLRRGPRPFLPSSYVFFTWNPFRTSYYDRQTSSTWDDGRSMMKSVTPLKSLGTCLHDRLQDEHRLPEGFKRVAYDADSGRHYFRDAKGAIWEGPEGAEFGEMKRGASESGRPWVSAQR
jgi:hypothetical protein